MKKKLEGELISIAHRVLKLKNRSETVLLQREARKLYEQLTVLRFYEENFETLKDDISQEQLEEKLEYMAAVASMETTDLEEKLVVVAQPVEETQQIEEIKEPIEVQAKEIVPEKVEKPKEEGYANAEDINRIVAEMSNKKNISDEIPSTNDSFEVSKLNAPQQFSFEDLLGESYKEPEFVRVEHTPKEVAKAADVVFEKKEEIEKVADIIPKKVVETKKEEFSYKSKTVEKQEPKTISLNDRLNTGISFGLNDRIAFEKKLFGGSADDFNRVISQLNTFDSFDEASSFITDFVKPDYNNWSGQEEYETRFLEIVEKKFN